MVNRIEGMKVNCTFECKGGERAISSIVPTISQSEDYVKQYIGIWKVMFDRVLELKAQEVLEFGTRDGYSTRLFSKALKITGGQIVTVDRDAVKEPFKEENIVVVRSDIADFRWVEPVDILYIDDWHNNYWLYHELEMFAKLARVVMVHDVVVDRLLLDAVREWCIHNMIDYSVCTQNGCGLAIIEVEKSMAVYTNENKPTGE